MTALNRKVLRDLTQMRGQMTAIALVIACGVAVFVLTLCTLRTLETARADFYDRCHFASIFAHLKRAPHSLRTRIAELPGVAQVQTRVVGEATLNLPDISEPASARLISLPRFGESGLNGLHLRLGRMVEPDRPGEVVVSEAFAQAHQLKPGDRVDAVLNGRSQSLHVVGMVLSPEYVFQIRPGDFIPDDKRYGIFWMGYDELAAAFDMTGAFNDISLTLAPGSTERDEARVIAALNDLTAPYGGRGAYGRREHPSDHYVSDELKQLRVSGFLGAGIFLSVAAFLLNVVLSRLIQTQREQIAALKAFGYSGGEIAWHYLKMTGVVVLAGTIGGVALGAKLGSGLTADYAKFYRFPDFSFHLDPGVVLAVFCVTSAAGALAVLGCVRGAVRLPPAEAMRPEPPAVYRRLLFERLGLYDLLSPSARMVMRNIERRPLRALVSILGIATATSTVVVGTFSADLFDFVAEFQFYTAQRQDMTVTFTEPTSGRVVYDVARGPGVLACEPFRTVPVRVRFGSRSRRSAIMGLPPRRQLYRLLNRRAVDQLLPAEGLVVSAKLAEVLGCRPGDSVIVEVQEGDRRIRAVRLAGVVNEFTGTNAYMDLHAVNRLMDEGDAVSGAMLRVDSREADALYATLKKAPRVSSVTIKTAALRSFNQTLAENMRKVRLIDTFFGIIIATGVIYNSARISLSERSRELASLRVLGFTRGEISAILLGELALVTFVAIPVGLAMGYGMVAWMITKFSTETLSFPTVIYPSTFGAAAAVTAVAAIGSALYVRRRLDHLDLVAVLKARE
jgi:putative ABC transport system permease protein